MSSSNDHIDRHNARTAPSLPSHIHMVGIAGIGVSALAQAAIKMGSRVTGSDTHAVSEENPAVQRLLEAGAVIYIGHKAENVPLETDCVVASSAIPVNNPELTAANERNIPVLSRAEFLGALLDAHPGIKIAAAGTHGKTTTTAMLGYILQQAKLDPTVFVGGEVKQLGGNVRIGAPDAPMVVEACEAFGSFLNIRADVAILMNVEPDHLDYYRNFDRMKDAFRGFVKNLPAGKGVLIVCGDDQEAIGIAESAPEGCEVLYYGVDGQMSKLDSRAIQIKMDSRLQFVWNFRGIETPVTLRVYGRHNLLNALGAATAAVILGVSPAIIAEALSDFNGAQRRQELLGSPLWKGKEILVFDDYAHHPTEISAAISALRSSQQGRRLIAIFQPHLYSRTKEFLSEFADALSGADAVLITDIYPAREEPIPGVTSADIARFIAQKQPEKSVLYVPEMMDIPKMLTTVLQPQDMAIFLGAGDIRVAAEEFLKQIALEEKQ